MSYKIRRTRQFKKDVTRVLKSGKDLEKLLFVVEKISEGRELEPKYKDHQLKGKYINK